MIKKSKTAIMLILFLSNCILGCLSERNKAKNKFQLKIISPHNRQYYFSFDNCELNIITQEFTVQKNDGLKANLSLDTIIKKYHFNLEDSICSKLSTYSEKINRTKIDTIAFSPNDSYYHEIYIDGKLKIRTQNTLMAHNILQLILPLIPKEIKCCDYFENDNR